VVRDAKGKRAGVVGTEGVAVEGKVQLDGLAETLGEEVLGDGTLVLVRTAFHTYE
jgi:hypothetical protein